MEWVAWGLTQVAKTGAKMALNACIPGLGSAIDFVEAAKYSCYGDVSGCAISLLVGVSDLTPFSLTDVTKDAMKISSKKAVVQTAKETAKSVAKEASRKVGQDLGKQFAMGTTEGGKDALIEMAKKAAISASKEANRKVGQQVRKEIAKGVIPSTVEEVWFKGTKMTVDKFLQNTWLSGISSGGHQIGKTIFEDWIDMGMKKAFKRKPIEMAFKLTKEPAKKGAEKEFMNQSFNLFVKDFNICL